MDHFDTNRLTPLKITLNLPKANTDLEIKVLSQSVLTSYINCVGILHCYKAMFPNRVRACVTCCSDLRPWLQFNDLNTFPILEDTEQNLQYVLHVFFSLSV